MRTVRPTPPNPLNRNPKMRSMIEGGLSTAAPCVKSAAAAPPDIVIFRDASDALPYTSARQRGDDSRLYLGEGDGPCEAMTSSCGDHEGHVSGTACPSQQPADGCFGLVHELSNLMTSVLLNAQMLEWKLPPYSHLKRPVREVARNAQRASELMRRLQRRCDGAGRQLPTEPSKHAVDLTQDCDPCTSEAFPKRDDRDGR
jgi:hypothetical protein